MSAEQKLRDALEAVRKDLLLRKQVTGAKSVELGNSAWWMLEEALALPPDPPVPALRFYSMQEDVPHEGQMCIVKINGVIQSVPFEFDAHDDDYGGSNHFWGHEELDECPKVDWETDEWMPWPTEENTKAEPSVPELAPATNDLVDRFAFALKEKLQRAQEKYSHDESWLSSDWMERCQSDFIEHVKKGDPRDVAAYCAFMWHHGWPTVAPEPSEPVLQWDDECQRCHGYGMDPWNGYLLPCPACGHGKPSNTAIKEQER